VKENKLRSANNTAANLGFEAKLWQAADALRNNVEGNANLSWVQRQ